MKLLKTSLSILIFFGLNTCCLAQSDAETRKLLHNYVDIQSKRIGFSGIVLVVKNNQIVYQEAIGKASYELGIPIEHNSKFRIASISKSFTAMLIALAAEEGKLSVNDSLSLFFPDIKNKQWRKVSVHQLLTHTSGVPHNEGLKDYWNITSRLPLTKEQALQEIFKMDILFEPGTNVKYSSPGYFLLACILENVYGKDYEAILDVKILKPLNMTNTGVSSTRAIVSGMTSGYQRVDNSFSIAPFRDFSLMKGSGDMYSTGEDLMKWNNSFSTDIWSKSLKKMLFTVHTKKSVHSEDYYGYGWFIQSHNNGIRQAYYHGGGSFGCSAITAWYPEENLSIIMLSNVSALPSTEMWHDIEKITFKEPFVLPELKETIVLSKEQLQNFAGKYISKPEGHELNIVLSNNQLYAKLGSNPYFEIYASNPLLFFGKKVNINLFFKQDNAGYITGLHTEGRGVFDFVKQ